jgi:hypothetical protein
MPVQFHLEEAGEQLMALPVADLVPKNLYVSMRWAGKMFLVSFLIV